MTRWRGPTEMEHTVRFPSATAAVVLILAGCTAKKFPTQTYTATTDADGALHPVPLQRPRAARVTCVSAVGYDHAPAKCNVNGASIAPPDTVMATDKIYLFCEGTAPLRCAAKVEWGSRASYAPAVPWVRKN